MAGQWMILAGLGGIALANQTEDLILKAPKEAKLRDQWVTH